MIMRRRGAARRAARTAAPLAPGLALLAAGLAVPGTAAAAAAPASPVRCTGGVGDVPALVAAVRAGGAVVLAPGCTYRVTRKYGATSVLPTITTDTALNGRGATIAWEGAEDVVSAFDVEGPVRFSLRSLVVTSSRLPLPSLVRSRDARSVTVHNSMVVGKASQGTGLSEGLDGLLGAGPEPRPVTGLAEGGDPAASGVHGTADAFSGVTPGAIAGQSPAAEAGSGVSLPGAGSRGEGRGAARPSARAAARRAARGRRPRRRAARSRRASRPRRASQLRRGSRPRRASRPVCAAGPPRAVPARPAP
ncbi:hypothetical protein ACFQHO_05505 [Actinomadura yumaensis]|uniref:hypothetical protein n=1 Tax=Actinomadura yumaensis TaxID=111807 RepID=UPI003616359E